MDEKIAEKEDIETGEKQRKEKKEKKIIRCGGKRENCINEARKNRCRKQKEESRKCEIKEM